MHLFDTLPIIPGAFITFVIKIPSSVTTANIDTVNPFIGFKKAFTLETYANILKPWNNLMDQYIVEPQNQYTRTVPYIVELEIPEDAIRVSSSSSRKCRCSKAKVISITNLDGSPADVKTVYSSFDKEFAYTVGKTVSVDNFNINWWEVCASGIHFFITRQEAVDYNK